MMGCADSIMSSNSHGVMQVMESCHNGLDIAEADLHLRGGGSVFNAGVKQSGVWAQPYAVRHKCMHV